MAWKASPGVRWREVAGEAVLLDLTGKAYFALDEVGTFAWERLVAGQDLDQVASAIAASFEVEGERARADLEALVAELRAAGLLVPGDP